MNHGKFASSEVVKAIGMRLANGQSLSDARLSLAERIGGVAQGAVGVVGKAATLAVALPAAIIDPNTRDTLGDEAASLGASAKDTLAAR